MIPLMDRSMKHTNRYSNQTLNQHFYFMVSCKLSKLSQVEPLFWKRLTVKSYIYYFNLKTGGTTLKSLKKI